MKKFLFTILTLLAHLLLLIPITNLVFSGGEIAFAEIWDADTGIEPLAGILYGATYVCTVPFVTGVISVLHLVLFSCKRPNAPTIVCAVLGLAVAVLNVLWFVMYYGEPTLLLFLDLATIATWILWIVNGASSKRSKKRSKRKKRRNRI